MTNDKIIELAKQAGIDLERTAFVTWQFEFQRFAELVRNQALEEAAVICDELQDVPATEPRHCAQDIRGLKS